MRANYSNAFVASLMLHGAVAGLLVFFTYYVVQRDEKPPVIFELVAGPPTAPDELVAPAKGNTPNALKMDVPKVELEPLKPEVSKPEPPVPETVKAVETPPPPAPAKPTPAAKPKPRADNSISKELKKSERMSYREYLKKHPQPKVATVDPKTIKTPRIDAEGIAEGVKGGSTANKRGGGGGKALTREEQDQLSTYYSFLIGALRDGFTPPPGVSDKLAAKVSFDITASGVILNPRIVKSSGNREFDDAVLDAFRRVRSIGPTPDGKAGVEWILTFNMQEEQ
jgi:TonB family protein